MKIPRIQSGNAITRQYRNLRKKMVLTSTVATTSGAVFVHSFNQKSACEGAVSCAAFAIFYNMAMDTLSAMKKLKPQYKAIVKRAKRIYNNRG